VAPYWAERLVKLRQIDTHIFYRWTGAWGLPGAFTGSHAGTEPTIEKLAALATYVEELPVPLVDTGVAIQTVAAPVITLTPMSRPQVETQTESGAVAEEAASAVETAEAAAAPPPPPAVLSNPLVPLTTAPQRRSRIAAPR
jgi:hypothetical protein